MTAGPRVAPGGRRELGWFGVAFSRVAGRVNGTGPPNLFTTLGRHPKLFRGWLRFAGRLMPGGTLPRRDTELVILRVAHLRDCRYEFEPHVHLAAKVGVTAADVDRVVAGPAAEGWSARERAILAAVDELHTDRDLSDGAWADLRTHLGERERIELVLLAAHYEMLATTITALRIEPDTRRSPGAPDRRARGWRR